MPPGADIALVYWKGQSFELNIKPSITVGSSGIAIVSEWYWLDCRPKRNHQVHGPTADGDRYPTSEDATTTPGFKSRPPPPYYSSSTPTFDMLYIENFGDIIVRGNKPKEKNVRARHASLRDLNPRSFNCCMIVSTPKHPDGES